QQSLLDSEDAPTGPFAFRPITSDGELPFWTHFQGRFTTPIRFIYQPAKASAPPAAVKTAPPPEIQPKIIPQPEVKVEPPRVKKIPIRIVEEALPKPAEEARPRKDLRILYDIAPTQAPSDDYDRFSGEREPRSLSWILGELLVM